MNTLVHIIRFGAQESVAHAQKEHKVKPRFNCLIIKIGVYIIPAIFNKFLNN